MNFTRSGGFLMMGLTLCALLAGCQCGEKADDPAAGAGGYRSPGVAMDPSAAGSYDTAGRRAPMFAAERAAGEEELKARRKAAARPVAAEEILAAYARNAAAAQARFDGELVAVAGRIASIETTADGVPVIALYNSRPKANTRLLCSFSKDDAALLAGLKPRTAVVIVGTCRGPGQWSIRVDGCSIARTE